MSRGSLETIVASMLPSDRLRDKLIVMNGKGVPVYREIAGAFRFDRFELYLDHIEVDPGAPSATARVRIDQAEAQVPPALWESAAGRTAVQDFLGRAVRDAIQKHVRARWSGRIAPLTVDAGGQAILPRTCCVVAEDFVEVRLLIALPAEGRKVLSRPAQVLFFDELPAVIDAGLVWPRIDGDAGRRHRETLEDYLALRDALPALGLVAFLAEGAALPRESGPGDRPLRSGRILPLRVPDDLAVTITVPHRGPVRGLGIPRGVTVIAGSAFSGKSAVLAAISQGVYPHIPGDGRELVATAPDAVTMRAEPGRRIERVDVSAFVHELPHRPDVRALSVERASGVVSMAAAVAEALEVGTSLLLFDEDDGAIMFLAKDSAMQRLVPATKESNSPLVDRVRALWAGHGISTVIATGGLGEYLDVADTVIVMDGFEPQAATERARAIVAESGARRSLESPALALPAARCPLTRGLNGFRGRGLHAETRARGALNIGREVIDLGALPQLVDEGQARAAGEAILYAVEKGYVNGTATIDEIVDRVVADIDASGLHVLSRQEAPAGDYALPRKHEIAAILNRLKVLQARAKQVPPLSQAAVSEVPPEREPGDAVAEEPSAGNEAIPEESTTVDEVVP